MSNEIEVSKWLDDNMLSDLDCNLLDKFKIGTKKNIMAYISDKYPEAISDDKGKTYINREKLGEDICEEYFKKAKEDYSAEDVAKSLLEHKGTPPTEDMSIESLVKLIRELFNYKEYSGEVYIKRTKGGKNVACINASFLPTLILDENIWKLIKKQIAKAERKPVEERRADSHEWNEYELTTAHIRAREEMNENLMKQHETKSTDIHEDLRNQLIFIENKLDHLKIDVERTYLMLESLFSLFFTDFDFNKYAKDEEHVDFLDDTMDFGEDYQNLSKTLKSPQYNWEYYKPKADNQVLDVIAESVAEKIIKKMSEKES